MLTKSGEEEKVAAVSALSWIVSQKNLAKLREFKRVYGSGFRGSIGSNDLSAALDKAIRRLEDKLRTGQNHS
ncbi:MAG: hypothetical protein ABIK83_01700 [Candidatus Zixiibacteriota bacterium]